MDNLLRTRFVVREQRGNVVRVWRCNIAEEKVRMWSGKCAGILAGEEMIVI